MFQNRVFSNYYDTRFALYSYIRINSLNNIDALNRRSIILKQWFQLNLLNFTIFEPSWLVHKLSNLVDRSTNIPWFPHDI